MSAPAYSPSPDFVLTFRGARAVRDLSTCWWEIMSVTCVRCNLKYNKKDDADRRYHELPGGCR